MPCDVVLQRVEHGLRGELSQPREVAASVRLLQALEVAPCFIQESLDVEARRNVGNELAAIIRLRAHVSGKLRGRRRSHGFVAKAGVVHLRSLRAPLRQETHQGEHCDTGEQSYEKRADRGAEASLREQPAQAKARGESGERRKPAPLPGRLRRRRRLLMRRRSRLLRGRGDLALGPEISAATEPGGLEVIYKDACTEEQSEQGNDQFFHGLSPRFRTCSPGAGPRHPRSG